MSLLSTRVAAGAALVSGLAIIANLVVISVIFTDLTAFYDDQMLEVLEFKVSPSHLPHLLVNYEFLTTVVA